MTQYEKDQIARIQISQLVSADPMGDDFYYQVYTVLRGTLSQEAPVKAAPPLLNRHRHSTLDDQIQRIVENAKKRPKATQISLEGALGKISKSTTKNPRQKLQITPNESSLVEPHMDRAFSPLSLIASQKYTHQVQKNTLRLSETFYDIVLELEQLRRSRALVLEDPKHDQDKISEELESLDEQISKLTQTLWDNLQLNQEAEVPAVIKLLSCNKGKKLWTRLLRQLNQGQVMVALLSLFAYAQHLEVIRNSSIPALFAAPQLFPGIVSSRPTVDSLIAFVDASESFLQHMLPSMMAFVNEANWSLVSSCFEALLNRNDVVRLGSSRAGLAIITMLISRSEILNQTGAAEGWQDMFQVLFNEFQGHYLSFFPVVNVPNLPSDLDISRIPLSIMHSYGDPIDLPSGGIGYRSTPSSALEMYLTDDMHVWQFLAALAAVSNVDQQHTLVAEVRERILANVAAGNASIYPSERAERSIYNVNLFLHALGLDASQIKT
jgi:DNA topoisomerase 2-associated protein PAT1